MACYHPGPGQRPGAEPGPVPKSSPGGMTEPSEKTVGNDAPAACPERIEKILKQYRRAGPRGRLGLWLRHRELRAILDRLGGPWD